MPISSQRILTANPRLTTYFKDETNGAAELTRSAEIIRGDRRKTPSALSISSIKPQQSSVLVNGLPNVPKKTKCSQPVMVVLLVLLTLFIMALVGMSIVLPLVLIQTKSTTSTTTTTVTTTPTTSSCVSPYVRGSSGTCVNILLDSNNCGTVGYVCLSSTSCSDGVCTVVPVVQLTNAPSIWTGGINGSSDDDIFTITLPFSITLYNTTSTSVQVTTNGVICLSSCSNTWLYTSLPYSPFGAAVLPYWDDLYIYSKTWQGIYFTSQGQTPNRTLVFEHYTSHYGQPSQYYHFQVLFFEDKPGIVQFIYFDVYDKGSTGTVGVQGAYSGQYDQYSFNLANSVLPNMTLTFNTITGGYLNSTIG